MRYSTLSMMFLVAAGSAAGCKPTESKATPIAEQRRVATRQLDKAKVEAQQAARAVADYGYAQKDQFIATMKKQLANTEAELAQLSAQVEKGDQAVKADANVRLELARSKWKRAQEELTQAEQATPSTWDQIKGGFQSSYGELHDQVTQTRQWLSEKIAP